MIILQIARNISTQHSAVSLDRVGRLLKGASQTHTTFQRNIAQLRCAQHVAHIWPPYYNMFQHAGWRFEMPNRTPHVFRIMLHERGQTSTTSYDNQTFCSEKLTIFKLDPTFCSILQQGGQTCATCAQQVAICALKCCERSAGSLKLIRTNISVTSILSHVGRLFKKT